MNPLRTLLYVFQHTAARFIMADLAMAFRARGWPTLFVDFCPLLQMPPGADRERSLAGALAQIKKFAPELAVAYGVEAFAPLAPQGDLFSLLDVPQLNLFFDFHDWDIDVLRAHPLAEKMSGPDCLYCCWDNEAIIRMQQDGFTRTHYLPLAVNPEVFSCIAPPGRQRRHSVSFIGIATAPRLAQLEPLLEYGLQVYGPGSKRWEQHEGFRGSYHGAQNDRRKVNGYYNDSYMAVNVTQAHGSDSLNMRIFEALACGCLLLTDDKPVLRQTFVPGEELVIYPEGGLAAAARYYLAHPEAGAAIARRGCAAVANNHTYRHRVTAIAELLPAWLEQRRQYRSALRLLPGSATAAYRILKRLEQGTPPFGNREHLYFYLSRAAAAVADEEAANRYRRRLIAQNPDSMFLALPH